MATIAISDIHGNLEGLSDLLAQVEPELHARDSVVFLGDYIDRGPDSRGCIERVLRFIDEAVCDVVTLRGNHEDWLLRTLHDTTRHSWIFTMEAFETIASYSEDAAMRVREAFKEAGPRLLRERTPLPYELFFEAVPHEHLEMLQGLASYCRTDDAVFVHAGLDPSGGPVETQAEEILVHGHDDFPEKYCGPETVVYGHLGNASVDARGRSLPHVENGTFGIDTSEHGVVTALRLPDTKVFQSGALRTTSP